MIESKSGGGYVVKKRMYFLIRVMPFLTELFIFIRLTLLFINT